MGPQGEDLLKRLGGIGPPCRRGACDRIIFAIRGFDWFYIFETLLSSFRFSAIFLVVSIKKRIFAEDI